MLSRGATDGRTAPKLPPFLDPTIRRLYKDHNAFIPGINGDATDAATRTLAHDTLVRVPVIPNMYERKLIKALWDSTKYSSKEAKLALCIMHGAMRSGESNLKWMLKEIIDKFKASTSAQIAVNAEFNSVLKKKLKVRYLITMNDKGELNDIDLNGGEARALMKDLAGLAEGRTSVLMDAVRATRQRLGIGAGNTEAWATCLQHWGVAMCAGYKLRPTEADRAAFHNHARWYVLTKVCMHDEALVWYDWQMFSAFPLQFDAFGSLRLICQEGMEAQQRLNNDLQRRSNGGGNVGAVPKAVRAKGLVAIAAYMRERARNMRSPVRWIWEQMLLTFMAAFQGPLERLEALKAAGKEVDWATDYVPAWVSFMAMGVVRHRVTAKVKLWRVGGERTRKLLRAEWLAYRMPCECELEILWPQLDPVDRPKILAKARRARFADKVVWRAFVESHSQQ
jgi:hypothetical protein